MAEGSTHTGACNPAFAGRTKAETEARKKTDAANNCSLKHKEKH
jgi:hypothetical protein